MTTSFIGGMNDDFGVGPHDNVVHGGMNDDFGARPHDNVVHQGMSGDFGVIADETGIHHFPKVNEIRAPV